jgi:ketosteroid isomerase-like protein
MWAAPGGAHSRAMTTTGTSTDNRSTILDIYAAFGRGDIAGVLRGVADEVDWGLDPADPLVAAVPWLARVTTKDEVATRYFGGAGGDLDWHAFEPLAVGQDGDQVVSAIHVHFTVKATGRTVDALEAHHFTFGPDGRIAAYRPILDSAALLAAFGA